MHCSIILNSVLLFSHSRLAIHNNNSSSSSNNNSSSSSNNSSSKKSNRCNRLEGPKNFIGSLSTPRWLCPCVLTTSEFPTRCNRRYSSTGFACCDLLLLLLYTYIHLRSIIIIITMYYTTHVDCPNARSTLI